MSEQDDDILARVLGRSRYLRDIGEVKSPDLLDQAAAEITVLRRDEAIAIQERDRLRADLTAAQEREQRMREALEPGLSNLDALLNDHGYAEDGGMRRIVSELRAALGEPQ